MKIAIAHFRVGLTDGVSLEIDKRKLLLEEMGHSVSTIAGSHSGQVGLHIRYFEYKQDPKIIEVTNLSFEADKAKELEELTESIAQEIEKQLEAYWEQERFEVLFMHNLFCLPTCLPGSLAFYRFIKKHQDIKCITIHHDFHWEAPRVAMFGFTNPYAQKLLQDIFPPDLPNLTHCVINQIARQDIKTKRGIEAVVINDTFDYDQALWQISDRNKDYLQDVGVDKQDLQFLIAVRVRERKAVELAVDLMHHIRLLLPHYVGKKKYDGGEITSESKASLVIPGEFTEKEIPYVAKLERKAESYGVDIRWIQALVGSELEQEKGIKKYSLWDCYVYADAVLYTSHWEGFGNQFIEAVFAKKPVVVYEYPVFATDIKPAGFQVSSIGDTMSVTETGLVEVPEAKLKEAAKEILDIITDPERYNQIIDSNFAIGKEKFNIHTQLKKHLQDLLPIATE